MPPNAPIDDILAPRYPVLTVRKTIWRTATHAEVAASPERFRTDWIDGPPRIPTVLERQYREDWPEHALRDFATRVLAADGRLWTEVECFAPNPDAPRPRARLANWERDGHAEVSDGYLSNMAIGFANERARLDHEPRFCTRATLETVCPVCGAVMQERRGRFGRYYACSRCSRKLNLGTRDYEDASRRILDICGERLEARVNGNGLAYAGCPACHPAGDYERRPIGELLGARS